MIDPAAEPGEVFEGPLRRFSAARVLAFSGGPLGSPDWPERNPHTDAALARAAGFSTPVVSGQQAEGDLVRLMMGLFGPRWTTSGTLKVKFIRPLIAGDTVRTMARLRAKASKGAHADFEFEVWCETGNGDKVIVGEAKCWLP
ncbi:MAG: hypothetical protein EXQ86_09075 [Rhodospirillales bacterium]|nr:hypothetical protein [Rhodospirillales bacterium]